MYAEVLIEYTNKAVDKSFTYKIPNDLLKIIKIGMRVKVPFSNKIINGIVINIFDNYDGEFTLKEIKELVLVEFVLNNELLQMGKYLQEKTLCSKITAYQSMLPTSLKIKNQSHDYNKYDIYLSLNKSNKIIDEYINNNPRSKSQINILNKLKED